MWYYLNQILNITNMNHGERDEILLKFKLIELRERKGEIPGFGLVKSVKFEREFGPLPDKYDLCNLAQMSDSQLEIEARKFGISKSNSRNKADVIINSIPFSIKSLRYAPPALINHTTRPGFEFAASCTNGKIEELDKIIDKYWELRCKRKIGEDIHNCSPDSPFKDNKEVLKPFINYFLFKGTGSAESNYPAEKILAFSNPFSLTTWQICDESNAIDLYWDKLVFSIRAKKGMPAGYPHVSPKQRSKKSSVDRWTKFIDGDYRGSLHLRSK